MGSKTENSARQHLKAVLLLELLDHVEKLAAGTGNGARARARSRLAQRQRTQNRRACLTPTVGIDPANRCPPHTNASIPRLTWPPGRRGASHFLRGPSDGTKRRRLWLPMQPHRHRPALAPAVARSAGRQFAPAPRRTKGWHSSPPSAVRESDAESWLAPASAPAVACVG